MTASRTMPDQGLGTTRSIEPAPDEGVVIGRLASVQIGEVAPLGPEAVPSGFVKRPVQGMVGVRTLNIEGDAQADLRVHGGPDKAVYAYPAAHYPVWAEEFPEHASRLTPGVFGENLTIEGVDETELCVGDVHAIGSVRLQVCQPRQPCFKFALRLEDRRMPSAMVRSGRSGWYYRVLGEGSLQAGDAVRRVARPHPGLPFMRLVQMIYQGVATEQDLRQLAIAEGAARSIRAIARRSLGLGEA